MNEFSKETQATLRRIETAPQEPPPEEDLVAAIQEMAAAIVHERMGEGAAADATVEAVTFRVGSPRHVLAVAPPYPVHDAILPEGALPPPEPGPDGYEPERVMDWAVAELHRRFGARYGGRSGRPDPEGVA